MLVSSGCGYHDDKKAVTSLVSNDTCERVCVPLCMSVCMCVCVSVKFEVCVIMFTCALVS